MNIMKYISVTEYAKRHGIPERTVRHHCKTGQIDGAYLVGKTWNIPPDAVRQLRESDQRKVSPLLKALREQQEIRLKGGIYHRTQIDLTYNSNHIEGSRLTHDQTRFILLSGFVLCEADLRNFAHIKGLSGITYGLSFQDYDYAQKAIDRLKSQYLDVYLAFRNELFKKLMKVNSITFYDTTQTEAEFDSENQCAHYCVIMQKVFFSHNIQETSNILKEYISYSHLEG